MKSFNLLNDSKLFVLGLEQRHGGSQIISYMQSAGTIFLDALGETVKPKIKAVFLSASESVIRMGLYSQKQGRRPGRKRMTPSTRKIGGLIVDESVAPAHGLFECCIDLAAEFPPIPCFSSPIRQVIRTDGKTWQALVRDKGAEAFTIAEQVTLPDFGHGLEWAMPKEGGALFDAPQELYEFIEFLRRAMLDVDDKPDSAKKIASYGRELVYWLMAAEDAPRLERFNHQFCPDHDLHIGTLAPELQAAKILAYCITLDTAMKVIGDQDSKQHATNSFSRYEDWFSIAQCVNQGAPTKIVHTISQTFQKNIEHLFPIFKAKAPRYMSDMYDTALRSYCGTLWEELTGKDAEGGAFSSEILSVDRAWAKDVLIATSAELRQTGAQPTIVNIGAGVGNTAVEAALIALEKAASVEVYAGDPDPVAIQATRLRLTASRFSLRNRGQEFTFQCALGVPGIPNDPPASTRLLIVIGDCLPRFPSGAKATSDEFSLRFEQTYTFIEKYSHCVVGLKIPADFLDGKVYADLRQRLFASGRTLWVRYDETQKRPKDKRLAQAVATILVDAVGKNLVSPPEQYIKVEARPELQFSLMPPRLSGGYLSWPALTDIAAVPPFNGPIERRGMTLIDVNQNGLAERVREYLSPDVPDGVIAANYPPMMKSVGRFNAELSRKKIQNKAAFRQEHVAPYPFRPFDERFAYLREMRPLFSDPAPDLQIIASLPENWSLLASEGDAGIGDGVAAWASAVPCDYDFFAGRSRHFPVWLPEAILNEQPLRTSHGGWEHPKELQPKANLSKEARRLLERLGYPDPNGDTNSASLLWDFSLAVMYTPAYSQENQAALHLGWPRIPLPGWENGALPREAREIIEEYVTFGKTIRGILSGAELEHQDILSGMGAIRLYGKDEPVTPASLTDTQRIVSDDWGIPAKGNAVRTRDGALDIRWTEGALLKRIFELASAMKLPPEDCLERLGVNYANGRINKEVWWIDIPGAAWDFTIGGRKVLRKWLSYRDHRVIKRPLTPVEMEQFSDIARRLVMIILIGVKLDQMWPKLSDTRKE